MDTSSLFPVTEEQIMSNNVAIKDIRHPDYSAMTEEWTKWRYCFDGGNAFLEEYLGTFSDRESATAFEDRKLISPIPTFAKAAILEIRNSIHQRMANISRIGGPQTYQRAIKGELNGVDLKGNSMTNFFGRYIIPELLVMGKVGIFVDMPFS